MTRSTVPSTEAWPRGARQAEAKTMRRDHHGMGQRQVETMPPCIRRKAIEADITLDDTTWQVLPPIARERLVVLPVETDTERQVFARLAAWVVRTFGDGHGMPHEIMASARPDEGIWAWRQRVAPAPIIEALEGRVVRWETLDVDARFALVEAIGRGGGALAHVVEALDRAAEPGGRDSLTWRCPGK